jgi:hypothetical protein
VHDTFNTLSGFLGTVKATLFSRYKDHDAMDDVNLPAPMNSQAGLVQIAPAKEKAREEANV